MFLLLIILSSAYLKLSSTVAAATLYAHKESNDLSNTNAINECSSKICKEEASFFLNIMNETINPCDDFYQFVCGKFITNNKIPKGKDKLRLVDTVQDTIDEKLIKEIDELKDDDSQSFKKLKILFKSCKKNATQETVDDLLKIIKKAGGMPLLSGNNWNESNFDYLNVVFILKTIGFTLGFPVNTYVEVDIKNSRNSLTLGLPHSGVTESFLEHDPKRTKLNDYYDSMVNKTVILGADKELAKIEMKDCLDFEVELYKVRSPEEHLANVTATYNPMTLKELHQMTPSIPWMQHFNNIFGLSNVTMDEDEVVIVYDPQALVRLEQLLTRTPKKVIANYLMWQAITVAWDYFPDKLVGREPQKKSSTCLKVMKSALPVAVGALYVQKFLSSKTREQATELANYIMNDFKKILERTDWMDRKTKNAALEKAEAMVFSVGYPDEYLNNQVIDDYFRDLEVDDGSFFKNAFKVAKFHNKYNSELRKPLNKNEWSSTGDGSSVNAYYFPPLNTLELPAAILQRPFFHPDRPQYLNYGNLGATIGHEITHGFDSEGRKQDKNGVLVDWWDAATAQEYERKAQCFISQYSNYTVKEVDLPIDGRQTLVENIADVGGQLVAYNAYINWVNYNNKNVESRLPGLNYTPNQMFWISSASFFCGKFTDRYLKDSIIEDDHTPMEARVTIAFSNFKEFANDFQCPSGTKMNPKEKCTLWN